MKMTKFVAVAVAAAASLLASCGTTSNVNNVPMVDNETVMIDYQGKSMGGAIPKWVNAALDGTRSGVAKTLELDNKQLFVFIKNANVYVELIGWKIRRATCITRAGIIVWLYDYFTAHGKH